jgi:hypothetical protein
MARLVVEARGSAAEGPVVQGTQHTWAVGRYLLFPAVTRGADQGQTVSSVFVH